MKTYIVKTCQPDKEVASLINDWFKQGCILDSLSYDEEAAEWILIFKEG